MSEQARLVALVEQWRKQAADITFMMDDPALSQRSVGLMEQSVHSVSKCADALAAALSPEKLKSREMLKGTCDVLTDLDHAERMTDTSEPGYGQVVCSGRELDFVNRALRVARNEIKQLRGRVAVSSSSRPTEKS